MTFGKLEKEIRKSVTGSGTITIAPPKADNKKIFSVADFGAREGKNECNYLAFKNAINFCRNTGGSTLTVPKGVYYFNTDQGDSEAQLMFDGLNDFVFDGQGSEFIFSVVKPFIQVNNCERAVLKNFTIDWNWEKDTLASIGKIVEVSENGEYIDCLFPISTVINEQMTIKIVGPMDPVTLTPGCKGGIEFRPYSRKIVKTESEEVHRELENLIRELSNIFKDKKKIAPNRMRFFMRDPSWCLKYMKAGQVYNFRHYEYDASAVIVGSGSHLTFENIRIYSCVGHAFVLSGRLHHFEFVRCKVTKRPGTNRTISSTADCLHIDRSQGYFRIEECEFSHAGDDCINIHDNTSMGIEKIGEKAVIANIFAGRNPFDIGDPVEFRNADLSPSGYCSEVTAVEFDNPNNKCTLTFKDAIPEHITRETIIFNRAYDTSNYIIRNNRFFTNRARGMLIHGSDGLIEGNRFYKIQGAAVQVETGVDLRWAEGCGVRNVIFRDNWIESCDVNQWVMAVVYMGVYLPLGRTQYPIFNGLIFENNTIIDCPRLAFFLSSCSNILISGNCIINPNTVSSEGNVYGSSMQEPPIYGEKYRGTIMLSHASDVVITGNKRIETVETIDKGIYVDTLTSKNVYIDNNEGFCD